jgi:hypothetical protein
LGLEDWAAIRQLHWVGRRRIKAVASMPGTSKDTSWPAGCLPLANAVSARSVCVLGGVAMIMASM